ncbi:hypothetical protein [Microbacterium suwonense]|uniref:YCII-related domain-containing protein n=1 Tax=Microbacterium suwonense TaxID=683047 RepID=A0ABN6WYM6_9MICO|nr:hypothetical protein [Microbacterium suwonense]BDZ37571.1 hypothetical protein GCM10025863_01850 [Microbacterium suwonense]
MNIMKHVSLVGPVPTDEQARAWMAPAPTAAARAGIRSGHNMRDSEAFDDVYLVGRTDDGARNSERSAREEPLS